MSYLHLLHNAKLCDYICKDNGTYIEVWDLDGELYLCPWYPSNNTNVPNTIEKFK